MIGRRALIRIGLFSVLFVILALISLTIFSGFFSSAIFEKDKYILGEKVKVDLEKYEGNVKIKTPSTSFLRKSFNDVFLFEPQEIGFYEVSFDDGGKRKTYTFEVVEKDEFVEEKIDGIDNELILKKVESVYDKSFKISDYVSKSKEDILVYDSYDEKINDLEVIYNETEGFEIHFSERAIKPGIYKVYIENENYTKEFAYGLISLNTKKSIYLPGEEALLELVVLNEEGAGVCNALINMQIKNPNGDVILISNDDEIVSAEECGLYYVKYNVSFEGEYFVYLDTKLNEYEVNFSTSFLVKKQYDYEIIRETKSKIDPTQEDWFDVKINVKSLINDEQLEIREYVPNVFEIEGEGFEIEELGDSKILKWNIKDYFGELHYSYSVPHIWPYLYQLGPLEVNDFKEFRPWYVSVDPLIVTDTGPSIDISLTALDNNTFVASWIDIVEGDISFRIFDTNGSAITGVVDADGATPIGTDSRVGITALNSTSFVIAWINGSTGGSGASAAGYNRAGTTWFSKFAVEVGVGTPAVDIKPMAMVDRYQVCYIDDAEADADILTYLYSNPTVISGAETNLDIGANPDTALHNLFECAAVNATRFAAVWFDDSGDTASYSILNQDRTSVVGQTNLQAAGLTGQVSTTSLNKDRFAVAYYNSVTNQIRVAIRSGNNSAILAPITLDINASATSTTPAMISTATVRNQTANDDWFVVAWQDRNSNVINASVLNSTGSVQYAYTLANDENTTSLLFDIYGYDSLIGGGLCPQTYVLAYANNTNGVVSKTIRLDGSEWPGFCNFTASILTIHSPLNIIYNESRVLLNLTATNRGGFSFYTLDYGLNNVSMTTHNNFTWNSTNYTIADGTYTVRFYVNDTNRLVNDTVNVSFVIDTTGPKIAIINPLNNVSNYSSTSITFNLTLNENASFCRYTMTNGLVNYSMSNTTNFNWNATNTSIVDGFYTSIFYCNDTVRNWGTNSTTFRIDTIAPTVSLFLPTGFNYSYTEIPLNFTVVDSGVGIMYCSYSLDNGINNNSINNCQNTTFTAPQGFSTVNFFVNDSVGNLNRSGNVTFFVDSIKPLINFTAPTPLNDSVIEETSLFVNVSIDETNIVNITFELYNVSFGGRHLVNKTTLTGLNGSINWTGLNVGFHNYTYNVSVLDRANNVNSTEVRIVTVTGDITFPVIYIDYPLNYQNYSLNISELNYTVTESKPQYCWYSKDYGVTNLSKVESGQNFTFVTSVEGNNIWTVYCNDTSGNTNYTNITFYKDTTIPSFNISSPINGGYYNYTNILLNISVNDIADTYVWYNWNGTNYTYSSVDYVNFTDSNISINIWANDSLGNYNFTQVNFSVFVPIKFEIYSGNGSSINATTQLVREFNGLYDLQINLTGEDADFIYFYGYNKTSNSSFIFSSFTNETYSNDSFAFSAQGMVFDYANISLEAPADYLYKCPNWNMTSLNCMDINDWEIIRLNNFGERFNLTLTSSDPGFLFLNVSGSEILKDGYALESSPATEWGARTYMVVSNYTNGNAHSLIAFNISALPAGVFINNATLTLYCSAETLEGGESILVRAHGVYSSFSWSEGTGTTGNACTGNEYCWNNRPSNVQYNLVEDSSLVIPDGCVGKNYSFSVVPSVAYAYSNSYNNISFYLTPNETNVGTVTNDEIRFATRQFATSYLRPKLNISYNSVPRVNLTLPLTGSYYNYTMNVTIRANVSDSLVNISTVIANVTLPNGTINQFVLQNFSLGIYEYNFTGTNLIGRYNVTIIANNTDRYVNDSEKTWFYVTDFVYPLVNFTYPSEGNSSYLLRNWAYVNVTANDSYLSNITVYLFNDIEIINVTFSLTDNLFVNFTDLADGEYYYNASACDTSSNCNYTETRTFFIDFASPVMYIDYPLNFQNYSTNVSELNYSVIDLNPQACWYSRDYGVLNSSYKIAGLNFTDITSVEGNNIWTLYCNDTAGNTNYTNVTFLKDTIYPVVEYAPGTNVNWANISSDFIYVNVSLVEDNFANITFELYNDTDGLTLVNITTFYDNNRSINWTSLNDGNYSYNVTVTDIVNHLNYTSTRNIRIDKTNPLADLEMPYDNSFLNNSIQNFTVNITDNILIVNATLFVLNSTNVTINSTTRDIYTNSTSLGIVFDIPYDGNFTWYYEVRDTANNLNRSLNRSILVDLTRPNLQFIDPTLGNNSEYEGIYIYANVSVFEQNFVNITFELYNDTLGLTLINSTTFNDERKEINWSDLHSANITYYYFASAYDIANNINYTETRTIKLVDKNPPILNLIDPRNKTYFINTSIPLTFTATDINLQSCWYNVDQIENITIENCLNTDFNVSEGGHTFYLYANDSIGLNSMTSVIFNSNISQFVPYKGILAYGEGTVQIPRYRMWNGTGFNSEINASTMGGTIEWIRVASSPSRDENILVTADTGDDINVQINGTLPDGISCWHNGSTCGSVLEVETVSTAPNRLKADVAYETKGDEALVVWSQTGSPGYKVWNGTDWGAEGIVPQTLLSWNVSYVKMESHPFREEVALLMTNTTNLDIIIWNGSEWGCEMISSVGPVTPDIYQHADIAYEQNSGDLFVANNLDSATVTEINYTKKLDGSCTYETNGTFTLLEESEIISIGARYGSDHIMISQEDIGGNDMNSIVWNGSDMLAISGNDLTLLAETSPNQLIATGWAGTSDKGLVVYSDVAVGLNITYYRYNISNGLWENGPANGGYNATGISSLSGEERNIFAYSYIDENKTLVLVHDTASDLWAKAYDGDTHTWSQPDNGVTLENTVASASFPSFDFMFNYDRFGPQIKIVDPRDYYQNTSDVFLNITLTEKISSCIYTVDGFLVNNMQSYNDRNYYANQSGLSEGNHTVVFNCSDMRENYRSDSVSFRVDTLNPLVNFTYPTEQNASLFERDFIYVNVSLVEDNFANITFELYNDTDGLTLVNRTTFYDNNRSINWTGLHNATYYYNVTVRDLVNFVNYTQTRTLYLVRNSPIININYPLNFQNITGYNVSEFNFTVYDENNLINCSLYGNWTDEWRLNDTIIEPLQNSNLSFSSKIMPTDGYYTWNVYCTDRFNNTGFNSTNFTFSTFEYPDYPLFLNISQDDNWGGGNITLFWNSSNHSTGYRVYYSTNLSTFVFLNETTKLNYTDTTFIGNMRRFYRVDAFNPAGQNASKEFFGTHVYTFSHNGNTKNMVGFPTNASYLQSASDTLYSIHNATAFNMWNNTIQKRITCNKYSCPAFPSCTESNCDFNFPSVQGLGYEVYVNSTMPSSFNWSMVGIVYNRSVINLVKNSTNFGKNWIGIYANTSLVNAVTLIQNISFVDAVSNWNTQQQTSQGLIPNPFGAGYLGNNFALVLEKGYEISVNQSVNWTQI